MVHAFNSCEGRSRNANPALSSISTFAVSSNAHPILDAVLAGSLIVHTHIGFDACIIDYLHTRKFPIGGQVANWGLRAATLAALWGAYEFNTNDVGELRLSLDGWSQAPSRGS